jgi:hypothetical protein
MAKAKTKANTKTAVSAKTKASAKTAVSAKTKAGAKAASGAKAKDGINGIVLSIGLYKQELRKRLQEALLAAVKAGREGEEGGGSVDDAGGLTAEIANLIVTLVNEADEVFDEFGATLSAAERARLIGAGFKNLGFVRNAYLLATQNSALVPGYLDMAAFARSMEYLERKQGIMLRLDQFGKKVSDGILLDSDMAVHYALEFYNFNKEAAKQKVAGAESVYNKLKTYFKRTKQQSAEPTDKQVERDVRDLLKGKKEGRVVIENENPERTRGRRKVIDEARPDDHGIIEGGKPDN